MYTLQILDGGHTFFFSAPEHAVTIGSDQGAELRLEERDVAAAHARLEPVDGGLRLVALGPVRINGADVEGRELQLGDRIEIGRAVIVVGKAVTRAAVPEDVLDSPRVTSARREAPKRSKVPVVFVAMAIVGLIILAVFNSDDSQVIAGEFDLITRASSQGDFALAWQRIDRCRDQWQGAEDDRLQRLEREAAKIAAIEAEVARLEGAILDPASGGKSIWIKKLRVAEDGGAPHEQVAARLVRSSLAETMLRRPARLATTDTNAGDANAADAATGSPEVAAPAPNEGGADPAGVDVVAEAIGDAERLAQQQLFAQAIAVLQSALGAAPDAAGVTRVQAALAARRTQALAAANQLVAEARALGAAGEPGDGVTKIVLSQHRFPGDGEFAVLLEARRELEGAADAALAAARARTPSGARSPMSPAVAQPSTAGAGADPGVDESTRLATFAALRTKLDSIRDAEAQGDHVTATRLLREAATVAASRDPAFAARLEVRAEQSAWREALHQQVAAALAANRQLHAQRRDGEEVVLVGSAGARFTVAEGAQCGWPDLSTAGIASLVEQVGVAGPAALGAASMIYGFGDTALAEKVLATAVQADAELAVAVGRAIAHGRGERYDERGYVLTKEGFVSQRSIDLRKQADKVRRRIAGVFRNRNKEVRAEFVTELLAGGPDQVEVVQLAFEQDLREQLEALERSALRKQVEHLAEHRGMLDAARQHAKDLIYDEVKYFYPYKPPAVSGAKRAEYSRVQAEVVRRTESLRGLWGDMRTQVKVPPALRKDLDRLDWAGSVLSQLGVFDPAELADAEWARALPAGGAVTIRDYCRTVAERDELQAWRRIEAYNRTVGRELSSSVRELLRITNDYRAMFRHRPLAVSPVICKAAQGHAEEMSKLGYFAHHSPTPGRRTPFDRMRLAGYQYGVSENIATNGSALGAHNAWLGSSGHHRNLLLPSHREMGIGADGRNWVENFGGGSTYRDADAWEQAGRRGRRR